MSIDERIDVDVIASPEEIRLARLNAQQRDIRRRIVAIHEAGHATLGVLFDIRYGCAEVIDEFNGVVRDGKMKDALDNRPLDWCVMGAAGLAAELIYLAKTNQMHMEADAWQGARFDSAVIESYAGKTGCSVAEIRARSQRLVVANWQQIVSMHRALVARSKLSYQQGRAASGATETLAPTPLPGS